jgi:hypothetical protein
MPAPFMKVPTQSRTSLRFAKAILSSPRICPWFELTSVVLKRSSSVSAHSARSPTSHFRVDSLPGYGVAPPLLSRGQWPRKFCLFLPRPGWSVADFNPFIFCRSFQNRALPYRYGFFPVCRALVSPRGRHFRLPVRRHPGPNQRAGRLEVVRLPPLLRIRRPGPCPGRLANGALHPAHDLAVPRSSSPLASIPGLKTEDSV